MNIEQMMKIMNYELNPMLICDFYKWGHKNQYPKGTEYIYSTWTPRMSRKEGIDKVVFTGLQRFNIKYLIEYFDKNFFNRPKEVVLAQCRLIIENCLFVENPDLSHIAALHDLGYLPLKIMALPEGTIAPLRCPVFTIVNTDPRFFWLTNALETFISTEIHDNITNGTIAKAYREICDRFAMETVGSTEGVEFMCHDFSMRGMHGWMNAAAAGLGHLFSFKGTDTIPAIWEMMRYYGGNILNGGIGCSVPATEHSVECANMPEDLDEYEYCKRYLQELYPVGVFSKVSDTNDFFKFVTETVPRLKDIIMERDGKFVIRPDSGDPEEILCGHGRDDSPEGKGLISLLWEQFGGTETIMGYKLLDSHIGAIYGDSITLERAENILQNLKDQGFASINVVFGVGSYSYAYNTRDTFGQAFKSTFSVIDGEEKFLFKDPKTDDGTKKSQKGMVYVYMDPDGEITWEDHMTPIEMEIIAPINMMGPVFVDGTVVTFWEHEEIVERISLQSL